MPPLKPATTKRHRAATVIAIPKTGNRIYGDDVPMPWREAAEQTGIPASTFYQLIQRREIAKTTVGVRVMIRPSAVRDYLKRQETSAI